MSLTAKDKPVDQSNTAAIQPTKVRATSQNIITKGGVRATAQSTVTHNARLVHDNNQTKLVDVLTDAASKIWVDKLVTRQDVGGVMGAELKNNPNLVTHPGGIAVTVITVARLNESTK
ncbi:hypothetical protein GIB67_039575 [Kingdonia uniflora]|uniref:SMP domain-containing protein n=1 Tax=Kingdonia uniflora TaxID=39325 RepID=A0A7J7P6F6_9MAGN|nr:hypothetical protein GIB67_039575 [Kingdonia uniflora]